MQVIFTQDTDSAKKDEIRNVKPGYFRHLMRYGSAVPATEQLLKEAEARKAAQLKVFKKSQDSAKELAQTLKELVLEFTEKADGEHLYGSVSEQSIVDKLTEVQKLVVNKDQVKMKEHIKTTGEHVVVLHLIEGVDVNLKVLVSAK
jgi:large subunit ribosomal protein L9